MADMNKQRKRKHFDVRAFLNESKEQTRANAEAAAKAQMRNRQSGQTGQTGQTGQRTPTAGKPPQGLKRRAMPVTRNPFSISGTLKELEKRHKRISSQ